MKIFSNNVDTIKRELELIEENLVKINNKSITDNIEVLEAFYQLLRDVNGEEDEDVANTLISYDKYRDIKLQERKQLQKKNITNFINFKDFHRSFSGRVLDLYDVDFDYCYEKNLYLTEENMLEIICNFLNDEFNQADKLIDLINGNKIYRANIINSGGIPSAGYTMFDYITKNSFILVQNSNSIKDIDFMRIMVHEFGHVIDNLNKNCSSKKDIVNYYWLSSYPEVYALMYEKLFYDYLLKNKMFVGSTKFNLKRYYFDIYDQFNSLEYISSLDDKLLVNERYKRDEKSIIDQMVVLEDGTVCINDAILDDFKETNKYSYGGIMANYFANLKHQDPTEFKRQFDLFKIYRFELFNPNIFKKIGTSSDEMIKVLDKGLCDISEVKKLILK